MITLKNILKINAISSGATGLLLILFSAFIAELFLVPVQGAITEVGIFLVLFAAFVFYQSTKSPLSAKAVSFIIVLDSLWVVASLILVLFQLFNLSFIGYAMIAAVAVWVATMAILQANGLRQLKA